MSNQDPQTVSSRSRGKKKLEAHLLRMQERLKTVDEENLVLRTTLKLMNGETRVRNVREGTRDSLVYRSEYGDLLIPFRPPENWELESGLETVQIDGVMFIVVKVSRHKWGGRK